MNVFEWLLGLITSHISEICSIYLVTVCIVFGMFAACIGRVKTLDDLLPEEGESE